MKNSVALDLWAGAVPTRIQLRSYVLQKRCFRFVARSPMHRGVVGFGEERGEANEHGAYAPEESLPMRFLDFSALPQLQRWGRCRELQGGDRRQVSMIGSRACSRTRQCSTPNIGATRRQPRQTRRCCLGLGLIVPHPHRPSAWLHSLVQMWELLARTSWLVQALARQTALP